MKLRRRFRQQYDAFEVILSAVFGLSGVLQLFVRPVPTSSSALLPDPFRYTWLLVMIIGCVATLVGVFSPRVWGYIVEQVGLFATGGSIVVIGAAGLYLQIHRGLFTPQTLLGGPLIIAWGAAFLWKRHQLPK